MVMGAQIKCVFCKASCHIKWGTRKTENRGIIQKFKCLDCGKYFTNDDGFYRMRNSEAKITAAIDLYFSNLSSRKVRNHFRRHWQHNASHMSILDWCRRYTLKVQKYVATRQPQLSGQFYMDETETDRGRGNDIFWCNVDWGTRYINATMHSSHNQTAEDAEAFLRAYRKNYASIIARGRDNVVISTASQNAYLMKM